jgi:anti-anti-sigma factor
MPARVNNEHLGNTRRGTVSDLIDIRVETLPGGTRISVEGEVDIATAPAMERVLRRAELGGSPVLLLDLTAVVFIDAHGLRVAQEAQTRARVLKRDFALVLTPDGAARRLLVMCGVLERFEVRDGRSVDDSRRRPYDPSAAARKP